MVAREHVQYQDRVEQARLTGEGGLYILALYIQDDAVYQVLPISKTARC